MHFSITSVRMYSLASFVRADRFFYDLSCQTMDLDIHLDCCDTVMCTCNLESPYLRRSPQVPGYLSVQCNHRLYAPVTRPQEIPATGLRIGTPAAIRDMVDAQILA